MTTSFELFEQAKQYIPGGVHSPVRSFNGVGGNPLFIEKASGPYITDVEGKNYIDYVGSWGPLILGHAHPSVVQAVLDAAKKGLSYGAPIADSIQLVKKICEIMPNIEQLRLVNSGTEATMTAIRLARGYTRRDKIIKFEGCYHGHNDSLLVKAGSGALTFGTPSSLGVPVDFTKHTLVANFNDIDSVKKIFDQHSREIAAIILEPIACNMNCVPPKIEFLKGLRELCDQHQSLLIFDEVITGFRVHIGGAQTLYNIKPDLTTLGKIIGGGMPVGAFGGRKEIMEHISPTGPVYQAGTLSGNPIAIAAGLANLKELTQPGFYEQLNETTNLFINGMLDAAQEKNIPLHFNRAGSIFGMFFTEAKKITNFQDVMQCNKERYNEFFHGMLQQGIYFAPSAFESGFISHAHGKEEIEMTVTAARKAFSNFR